MHLALATVVKAAATTCPTPTKVTGSSIVSSIAKPIADVLAAVYSVIPNYAAAIIALSIIWMLIIAPLTLKSTRSMLAMQKLQPELKKLQQEHKNDRQAFAQAQMDLFKEHNVSPFGSCLPMLLPLPVFFALFEVIDGLSHKVTVAGVRCAQPNYLSPHTTMYKAITAAGGQLKAFGVDLSKGALSGHTSFLVALPYFVLLLVMIGTQYAQSAQMMSRNPAAQDNPQAKMMKYLPIVFGIIFIRFPAGVILYYAMSNICRIGQQTAMYRFDPKVKSLANRDLKEVEAEVDEIERGVRRRDKEPTVDPPAPRSRFRDLLAKAAEQQQQNRDKTQSAKDGASRDRTRPSPGRGPQQKGGTGKPRSGSPTKAGSQGAKAQGRSAPPTGRPKQGSPNAKGGARPNMPTDSGGRKPPGGKGAAPSSGAPAPGSKPPAPGSKPPAPASKPPAPETKAPSPGGKPPTPPVAPAQSSRNGAGITDTPDGRGNGSAPAGNGNGAATPPPRPAGRTGASGSRPKKRRGR